MDVIKEEFQIIPIEQPFFYIKDLQASFDYSKLKFSEEYYELMLEAVVPEVVAPEVVAPEVVAKFINKWHLYEENNSAYSNTEYEQIQEEHPLNMDFNSKLFVNDIELRQAQGCCVYWIPKECMSEDLRKN